MKIIFFNINQFINDPEGLKKFFTVYKKSIDIFCIQEIPETPDNSIDNILSGYSKFHYSKTLPDVCGKVDLSTYVRKTGFNLVNQTAINTEYPDVSPAIITNLEHNNIKFNIINYHGVALPGHKGDTHNRIKASQLIIDQVSNLEGHKIIGGDFNLNPDSKSITMFEKIGYLNLIKEYKVKTTRNNNAWKLYPNDRQYYADYTLIDNNLKINNFKVISTQISDHLPMLLDI